MRHGHVIIRRLFRRHIRLFNEILRIVRDLRQVLGLVQREIGQMVVENVRQRADFDDGRILRVFKRRRIRRINDGVLVLENFQGRP